MKAFIVDMYSQQICLHYVNCYDINRDAGIGYYLHPNHRDLDSQLCKKYMTARVATLANFFFQNVQFIFQVLMFAFLNVCH